MEIVPCGESPPKRNRPQRALSDGGMPIIENPEAGEIRDHRFRRLENALIKSIHEMMKWNQKRIFWWKNCHKRC